MTGSSNSNSTGSVNTNDVFAQIMSRGVDQLERADKTADRNGGDEKTEKLFGLVEVPEMFATVIKGLWNEGSDQFNSWLQKNTHSKFLKAGEAIGLQGNSKIRTAAGATIALHTAVRALPYFNPVAEAMRDQHKQRKELVEKTAPVLDALKGKHTLGALMSVKREENEMLFYARRRLTMTANNSITNNVMQLLVNVVPGIVKNKSGYQKLWNGEPADLSLEGGDGLKGIGNKFVNFGAAPIADVLAHSRTRKLNRTLASPYSALDMALELAEQAENNPHASNFQLPGKHAKSLSLEQYIEQICLMHQKNMAEISNDHVEIRPALKEDLAAVVKPLANAIREGKMDPIALISLVGEGKIIKGHGRAVANPAEVEALIEKQAAQPVKQAHVDPKEYYKGTPYTKDELKEALGALEGEEKDFFVALLPDEVLADLGMSKDAIKQHRDAATGHYHRSLADAIMGIAEGIEDDKALAHSEKKALEKAESAIASKGEDAAKELHGQHIEQTVLNWAVPKILGDKSHFGTVMAAGHQKLAALQDGEADAPSIRKNHAKQYADRAESGHAMSHQERAAQRREHHAKGSESYME